MKTEQDFQNDIIKRAFELNHALIAGDYHLPTEMCLALNNLNDAVYNYISIDKKTKDKYLSSEWIQYVKDCRKKREEILKLYYSKINS